MKPDFLNKNDRLYLVAPSFGCTTKPYTTRIKKAIKVLTNEGYKITEGENIYQNVGVVASNTPEIRAREIHDAFKSDSKVVWSVGGGELMCEILPFIDFNIIKENPKWFVGFSDNTNLCYTITTITGIETIYGVNAPAMYRLEYDTLDTLKMLKGINKFKGYKKWQLDSNKTPLAKYNLTKRTKIKAYNYIGPVEGIIIGGCLDCLINLCGTKYDYTKEYEELHKDQGIIFFMEACDLNSLAVRRALFQLKNAGWFKYVKMFIIGKSYLYDDKYFNQTMEKSYKEMLLDLGCPILYGVSLGHRAPSIPIRIGAKVKVEYKEDKHNIFFEYDD